MDNSNVVQATGTGQTLRHKPVDVNALVSCIRLAYQRLHAEPLVGNWKDVRNGVLYLCPLAAYAMGKDLLEWRDGGMPFDARLGGHFGSLAWVDGALAALDANQALCDACSSLPDFQAGFQVGQRLRRIFIEKSSLE